MKRSHKHILIIGGGLSGLITAVKLQQQEDMRVTIIEKTSKLGGLCGTFTMEEQDYVIGCNDFGIGMSRIFESLDVKQEFVSLKSKVFYNGRFFDSQVGLRAFFELLPDWKNLFKLLLGIISRVFSRNSISIEKFVDDWTSPGLVNDYAKLVSYFMGVKPSELSTSFFSLDGKYNYGYKKMICPVGGPQIMVDSLASKFLELGGGLKLNTEVINIKEDDEGICVKVKDVKKGEKFLLENINSVVNTGGAEKLYKPDVKQGMRLSSMCICVSKDFLYPEDTHTLTYYPKGVSEWFSLLDEGLMPKEFGFHVFNSRLKKYYEGPSLIGDVYTLNVFFYTPRGKEEITQDKRDWYTNYIYERLEAMLPGITKSITKSRVIDPNEYHDMHGVSSSVMPFISDDEKPKNKQGKFIYYAGHHVYPPGDHAGASAQSALNVVEEINKITI